MNEDGTRDVEEEREDELVSPPTLLRRILQRDSHALTAGFEVSMGGGAWCKGAPSGACTLCCVHVRPGTLSQEPS